MRQWWIAIVLMCCSLQVSFAEDFLHDKTRHQGFIDVLYSETSGEVFLAFDRAKLGQQLLFQSSLSRGVGSNDIGLDRGQLGNTRLVQFDRFGNKILLRQLNTQYRASSQNQAERDSIDEAFADSIIAGFKIAHTDDEHIYLNYTKFLLSDIHGISERLASSAQGQYALDMDRSAVYMPRTKAFPRNTELEAVITFAGSPKGQYIRDVTPDAKSVTVHLHHSFIALPEAGYEPRVFHPFSGFWKHSYVDYSAPLKADMEVSLIPRHRLSKQNPEAPVSEALEPIVYYLDPGIPEPVMSALKEGAMWWDQAFAAAGYKNAFQVRVLPADADPMDVRYNVIQWVHRATRGWSYGSSVIDPRTGEIIKGHVTLGSLRVRQDYLIALGLTSPFTQAGANTDEQLNMALDRIKQLSAHEVGHTLGIAHNFAASEKDRASVMDYPHPLLGMANDKIVLSDAYDKGIGAWDKYVVAYGYQDFPDEVNTEQALNDLVDSALAQGFTYKSDPDARIAKRASADGHLWDNGADPIIAFNQILDIRQQALQDFGAKSLPFGAPYSDLDERLVPIYYMHRYQLDALLKQISGLDYEYSVKTANTERSQVSAISGNKQGQALSLVINSMTPEVLSIPKEITALIPPKAYGSTRNRESMKSRMGIAFDPVTAAESIVAYTLQQLFTPERLNRLAWQHYQDPAVPSVAELAQEIIRHLVRHNKQHPIAKRTRLLALGAIFGALDDDKLAPENALELKNVVLQFDRWIQKNKWDIPESKLIQQELKHYWQTGTWRLHQPLVSMPPGSPI